ncbi:MAG: CotH kinase family protein [Terrisporobacter sp.]
MVKNIFKFIMALSFALLALLGAAFLQDIKETAKVETKKIQVEKLNQDHSNDIVNKDYNLPIVIIDSEGKSIERYNKISANISIYDNKDGESPLSNDPQVVSEANVKIRGNSTSKYPKKQYTIELVNKKGEENKQRVLGMKRNSDWVLNGPFADKSLIRNYIALKTSRNIMDYAPNVKFCEVFLLDDNSKSIDEKHYRGVYIMIEKIKRDDDRVDITKSLDNLSETSFILAKDRQRENDVSISTYGKETYLYNNGFNVIYPKNSLTEEKYNYIEKHISEFERILYSGKFNDPINGYEKYIDVDSFVDFYIINEFFKNTDAGMYSTYIYKDYEEKIKAGPVWDFNRSLGNYNNEIEKDFDYTGFFMNSRPWFNRLSEDINFSKKVKERYKELRNTYLSDDYLLEFIDKTVVELGDAPKRNFNKWDIKICNQAEVFEENGDVFDNYLSDVSKYEEFLDNNQHLLKSTSNKAQSFEEEISLMKNFIVNRGKWIDENIDTLNKWAK